MPVRRTSSSRRPARPRASRGSGQPAPRRTLHSHHRRGVAVGVYSERVLPHLINVVMNTKQTRKVRARVCTGLAGDIVEIGFGTGHNLPFMPPSVTRVRAVEPAGRSVELESDRIAASGIPVEGGGPDGQALPLADDSADAVLSTWSLCTIPDAVAAV